jgi:LmbE family N-acetylglucosaminyl deacetylase
MEALTPRFIQVTGTSAAKWQAPGSFDRAGIVKAESLVPAESRAVIIAPHPDDEILGMGGLMAQLAALGRDILLIAVTDGTASHPGSSIWPPAKLAKVRPAETITALRHLQLEHISVVRAGFPDGAVSNHRDQLVAFLAPLLRAGDVVFATWRFDGHPDHEAVGLASAIAAKQARARLIEVPIWAWHWATPGTDEVPWHRARRVPLDDATFVRKRQAMRAFKSQLTADPSTEAGPIVPASALARLLRKEEIFFV